MLDLGLSKRRLPQKGSTALSNQYADAWGNRDLKTNLIQIGNNHFSEHGDLAEFAAEKIAEAEAIQSALKVQSDEVGVEIGSGTGVHAAFFAGHSKFLTSFDVTDGFLELFKKFTADTPNLRRIRKDFFPMMDSLEDNSIDYVYSTSVFCHLHIYDIYLYFEEIARVLKPGGRFFVNYQNADNQAYDDFFQMFLENYRGKSGFEPIHPGQMQFHSNAYFFNLGKRFSMQPIHERIVSTYSELIFAKGE